jgi:hypothetical protein
MATRTVMILSNNSTFAVPVSVNTAADIAGLMNAGTQKVYSAVDVTDGNMHHVRVDAIIDVYEYTTS